METFDPHGFLVSPQKDSFPADSPVPHPVIPVLDIPNAVPLSTVASASSCSCPKLNTKNKKRQCKMRNDSISNSENIWLGVLDGWKDNTTKSKCQGKIEKLLSEGVPASIRPKLWKTLLESETLSAASKFDYKTNVVALREQLVDVGLSEYGGRAVLMALNHMSFEKDSELLKKGMIPIKTLRQIMADQDRTYPNHRMFMGSTPEAKEGRTALFRVLAVYARYNKQVGYCQGMSYIAGMLLMLMEEEDAFWCIVSLLERHKYLLGYFDTNLTRIHMHGHVFNRLLRHRHTKLAKHFHSLEIEVLMFITPWFMSLFTSLTCWDSVLAIWDLLIVKGFTTIFQVSLAIIALCEDELLKKTDMSTLLPVLLRLPHNIVAYETLLPAIQAISVEKWEIDGLQAVIEEEVSMTRRKRRRTGQQNKEPHNPQAKRQKTLNGAPSQGLFGKLANMFSWTSIEEPPKKRTLRHRPTVQANHRVPGKVRNVSAQGYPFEHHISPCEEAKETSGKKSDEVWIPVRRSPRILAMSNQNVGHAPVRLVGKSAKTQYTFKEFTTPTPLRQTQKMYASPTLISSPVIEMKPMTRK